MSLLDRVQRKAEGTPAPSTPAAPAAPAPSPERTQDVENDRFAPAGWQQRQSPGPASSPQQQLAPAPAPVRPAAPAPRPFEAERPAATEPQRAPSLLNRAGGASGLGRPGLSKMGGHTNTHVALRAKVHQRLVEELAQGTDSVPPETVRQRIAELLNDVITEQNITMSRPDRLRLVEILANDVLGLGPLEELLASEEITEIMINSYKQIYVEQHGKLTLSPVTFESDQQLMQVIDRIVSSIGRRIDESSPMVDARLKDGSRVNVIIPPLALRGPTMTIRKFAKEALTIEDLIKYGSITDDMVKFLRACVRGKLNVVVSGGTGSGKTTTLNILSSFIPEDERIVTIEDAAELQLRQEHVVTLETRPANVEGRGRVSIRDLVINSLRMRPDRIVVGECRGGEALDMLQAMNTGHDGSLTTLHANNAHDCISRLETLVLMAGAELPSRAIREQIGSAVNVVVQQSRLRDGTRKIVSITEVLGCVNNEVQLQDIFTYKQTGVDDDGKVVGSYMPTGVLPTFLEHLTTSGEEISEDIFQPIHVMDGVGSA
ncbi:MAG: CpaF family protein [Candidatus Dormiibacterota bacterium]